METHIYSGYTVPPFYDSLIGKIISYGETRAVALARMRQALDELHDVVALPARFGDEIVQVSIPSRRLTSHDHIRIHSNYDRPFSIPPIHPRGVSAG